VKENSSFTCTLMTYTCPFLSVLRSHIFTRRLQLASPCSPYNSVSNFGHVIYFYRSTPRDLSELWGWKIIRIVMPAHLFQCFVCVFIFLFVLLTLTHSLTHSCTHIRRVHESEGALNLQGIEFARNGVKNTRKWIFKERPHNSHPCEFARNGFIQEINKWNSQGNEYATNGLCSEQKSPAICGITLFYLLPDARERKRVLDSPKPEGWNAELT